MNHIRKSNYTVELYFKRNNSHRSDSRITHRLKSINRFVLRSTPEQMPPLDISMDSTDISLKTCKQNSCEDQKSKSLRIQQLIMQVTRYQLALPNAYWANDQQRYRKSFRTVVQWISIIHIWKWHIFFWVDGIGSNDGLQAVWIRDGFSLA